MNDIELLNQYKAGNMTALDQLIEQHRRPLYGFILNMIDAPGDADDVFQEVWMRVIRNIAAYEDRSFLSWLIRIARNLIIDRFRRKKPVISLEQENRDGRAAEDVLADKARSPAQLAAGGDLARCIQAAVDSLPDDQREVFLMRVEADLPFKEIAAIQKVSINTALARMQYALSKLRASIGEEALEAIP